MSGLLVAVVTTLGCAEAPPGGGEGVGEGSARSASSRTTSDRLGTDPDQPGLPAAGDSMGGWDERDWEIFREKVRWGVEQRLDTLLFGSAVATLGRTFVGTPYIPRTLEVEGPEGLVINFRGLDCVTFVETALALTRFIRAEGERLLADRPAAEARYEALLRAHRYRDGRLDGYPSRLHYFTDWISDNERRGLVVDLTSALGGSPEPEPIDFMSTHPDAYRQLSEPGNLERIRETEAWLSARPRSFIPEARIANVASQIRDGDVIAATSTVPGLDVAHTGFALWIDGSLHLLHAPLVGDAVQISEVPLAERVAAIASQDGILVARPRDAALPFDRAAPRTAR